MVQDKSEGSETKRKKVFSKLFLDSELQSTTSEHESLNKDLFWFQDYGRKTQAKFTTQKLKNIKPKTKTVRRKAISQLSLKPKLMQVFILFILKCRCLENKEFWQKRKFSNNRGMSYFF